MSTSRFTDIYLETQHEAWHLPHIDRTLHGTPAPKVTEAELDAAIADRADPWPHCTGACDQGRAECTCETGMPPVPPVLPMWDVEREDPRLSAGLCALAIVASIAISALLSGCGGSDDDATAPDTPSPRPPTCSASGACA